MQGALEKQLNEAEGDYKKAAVVLQLESRASELTDLRQQSQNADFWNDTDNAQSTMQQIAKLEALIDPWQRVRVEIQDLRELVNMNDTSLEPEITKQLNNVCSKLDELKEQLKFNGPYDTHNALLTLSAGAGGTDAQDWTQMLLRMYTRWAEHNNLKVKLIEESAGEEAGLKRATIEISGPFVFGKLKGEHGVHRLVRLSPFNSDNLRQTSFAKVDVLPEVEKPDELAIDAKELKIDVYRAGGHGGQSVNTTDSAVRVTHIPTGITVAIQNERSQLQNKETAMTILRSRLAQLQIEQHKDKLSELKGPNQSAEWGNQIRSYVLHPYKQVKDVRTKYETSDAEGVLDGNLEPFIHAYLESVLGQS